MAWAPDYCTAADLKAYLHITDTVDDAQVALAVTTASRAVDKATGRQFGQVAAPAKWYYTPVWDRRRLAWTVTVDDIATQTGMIVELDDVATTDYVPEPRQAVAKGQVWTSLMFGDDVTCSGDRDCAAITASWGWASVPVPVKQAALLQASRFLARRDSPYGIAGSPADGSEMRLMATVDPDVRVSLGPYVRPWAVA